MDLNMKDKGMEVRATNISMSALYETINESCYCANKRDSKTAFCIALVPQLNVFDNFRTFALSH
ncbi:hypothetical protein KIN20_014149 [Parelaphostrongylus tenuis]|uniref:Uncharacterized protein n=1 Tax=Parelaphostrongylus tenuis TaxID=148309 RepID=A0AAD5MD65_PARTN|nr:hypothetical protein KIN20_014149 [Parelaphostrongylus tenuis]